MSEILKRIRAPRAAAFPVVVETAFVQTGQEVTKGSPLYVIRDSEGRRMEIRSPLSGTVEEGPIPEGAPVGENMPIIGIRVVAASHASGGTSETPRESKRQPSEWWDTASYNLRNEKDTDGGVVAAAPAPGGTPEAPLESKRHRSQRWDPARDLRKMTDTFEQGANGDAYAKVEVPSNGRRRTIAVVAGMAAAVGALLLMIATTDTSSTYDSQIAQDDSAAPSTGPSESGARTASGDQPAGQDDTGVAGALAAITAGESATDYVYGANTQSRTTGQGTGATAPAVPLVAWPDNRPKGPSYISFMKGSIAMGTPVVKRDGPYDWVYVLTTKSVGSTSTMSRAIVSVCNIRANIKWARVVSINDGKITIERSYKDRCAAPCSGCAKADIILYDIYGDRVLSNGEHNPKIIREYANASGIIRRWKPDHDVVESSYCSYDWRMCK